MWRRPPNKQQSQQLPRIWRDKTNARVRRPSQLSRGSRLFTPKRSAPSRRPLPRWFWQTLGLLALVAVLAAVLLSPLFAVSAISVSGTVSLPSDNIKQKLPLGQNIWRVPVSAFEDQLRAAYPAIQDVSVDKGLPSQLKVTILERSLAVGWQSGGKLYAVDGQGVAYGELSSPPSDTLLITDPANVAVTLGQPVATPQVISFVLNAKSSLEKDAGLTITGAHFIETTFDVSFQAKEGWQVMLATDRGLHPQISSLQSILKEKHDLIHEYIDLRVQGLAFVK